MHYSPRGGVDCESNRVSGMLWHSQDLHRWESTGRFLGAGEAGMRGPGYYWQIKVETGGVVGSGG